MLLRGGNFANISKAFRSMRYTALGKFALTSYGETAVQGGRSLGTTCRPRLGCGQGAEPTAGARCGADHLPGSLQRPHQPHLSPKMGAPLTAKMGHHSPLEQLLRFHSSYGTTQAVNLPDPTTHTSYLLKSQHNILNETGSKRG